MVRTESIDEAVMQRAFPLKKRRQLADEIATIINSLPEGSYNEVYFGNPSRYQRGSMRFPQSLWELDLYPPNLAVLDWALKHKAAMAGTRHIDIGCGMGLLVRYLREIGIDAYGFDTWEQLPRTAAEQFIGTEWLADDPDSILPDSVSAISVKHGLAEQLDWTSARLAFIEDRYAKKEPENFHPRWKPIVEYPTLIHIYERQDHHVRH